MSQLTNMQVQIVDGLSVGDQESDCDDDDRRELISHYANDKYLSKWELAEEEEEIEEEQESLDDKEPNIDNSEKLKYNMMKSPCSNVDLWCSRSQARQALHKGFCGLEYVKPGKKIVSNRHLSRKSIPTRLSG